MPVLSSTSAPMFTTKVVGGVDIESQETMNASQSATLSTNLLQTLLNYRQSTIFSNKEKENNDINRALMDKQDELKELSGMMLSHCLLYKNNFFDAKSSVNSYLAFDQQESLVSHYRAEPCLLCSKITATNVKTTTAYLNSIDEFLARNNSIDDNGVLWVHILGEEAVTKTFNAFKLETIGTKCFLDKTPRSYIHKFKTLINGVECPGFVSQSVSLSLSSVVYIKILHAYVTPTLIITYERYLFVVTEHSSNNDHAVENRDSVSGGRPLVRSNSFTTSQTDHLKSNLLKEDELHKTRKDSGAIDNGGIFGKIQEDKNMFSDKFLDNIILRLKKPEVRALVNSQGAGYLYYEAMIMLLIISFDVMEFISRRMLKLHDEVFVRAHKPGYSEGNMLRDHIDTLESCLKLVELTIDGTYRSLELNENKISNDEVSKITLVHPNWFSDLLSSYKHLIVSKDHMCLELKRVESVLVDLISRRNDRINLLLSMVATIFLPLSFITGVFGMNFSYGGAIVYILRMKNGSIVFWLFFVFVIVVIFYWFSKSGFFEMLTVFEKNKHTEHFLNKRSIDDHKKVYKIQ